jgi:hypothetical protein
VCISFDGSGKYGRVLGWDGAVWCDSGAKNLIPETKKPPHKNGKSKDDFFHTNLLFSLEEQYRQ